MFVSLPDFALTRYFTPAGEGGVQKCCAVCTVMMSGGMVTLAFGSD